MYRLYGLYVLFVGVISCLSRCQPHDQGERLAKVYCASCHLFPEPGLLDKHTWIADVLPEMAVRMGFRDMNILQKIPYDELPIALEVFPKQPLLSDQEWLQIVDYYQRMAPDSLIIPTNHPDTNLTVFQARPLKQFTPLISLLAVDSLKSQFIVGTRQNKLYHADKNYTILDSLVLPSPPSDLAIQDGNYFITTIGNMDPTDQPLGQLIQIDHQRQITLIDSLRRPVCLAVQDLNADGITEFIIGEHGHLTGGLSIYFRHEGGLKRLALHQTPGTREVEIKDINHDGRPDIIALMAQGDERIVIFENQGDLSFSERRLLQFPPVYGSSYFVTADVNGDHHLDIVCTFGDNADYSMIVKPYHGVRIYLGDEDLNFKLAWSYFMPGASMVRSADYDGDGDIDFVANAYFPDFIRQPLASMIYFEQSDSLKFNAHQFSAASGGRWLVLEHADLDLDGDLDVYGGAMNFSGLGAPREVVMSWRENPFGILFLENKSKP